MEQKIFIPFPRVCCCRWERQLRGHPAPARAARGGGGPGGGPALGFAGTPGPGPAQGGQLWGAACSLCPRVWGRAEGPRGERRLQNLGGKEEAGGRSCSSPRGRTQPHGWGGEGRAWSHGTDVQGPALPHGCPAPPGSARHGRWRNAPRGRTSRPPPWDTLSQEWGSGGGCWGAFRARQRKGNYPPLPPPP